ncbi:MAG: YncE family protein, partial [Myxococcales bacterium]
MNQNHHIFRSVGCIATILTLSLSAKAQDATHHRARAMQLPSGQFVTPTAISGALQQYLNPRLPAYPKFIAGEAVRSQLSPDGTTLAVLCAGNNSLYDADGKVDTGASTQFIFLYDVAGRNQYAPALKQVIQQANAHVGLAFSPDGKALYAAGGRDDAVYAYTNNGSSWSLSNVIDLGHGGVGLGIKVAPNTSGLAVSKDGKTLVAVNNYNDSISVVDLATGTVRYEYDLRPYTATNEGKTGG